MSPIPESDSKRLRHHTPVLPARADVAAAEGESEESYSAAQRLLDEAVDQAVREDYPAAWVIRHPQPTIVPLEYELRLACGEVLTLRDLAGQPYCSLCIGHFVGAPDDDIQAAKPLAIALVIERMQRALEDLRARQAHDSPAEKPAALREMVEGRQHAQPSVTAATSAALVENYAGKEVSP